MGYLYPFYLESIGGVLLPLRSRFPYLLYPEEREVVGGWWAVGGIPAGAGKWPNASMGRGVSSLVAISFPPTFDIFL